MFLSDKYNHLNDSLLFVSLYDKLDHSHQHYEEELLFHGFSLNCAFLIFRCLSIDD